MPIIGRTPEKNEIKTILHLGSTQVKTGDSLYDAIEDIEQTEDVNVYFWRTKLGLPRLKIIGTIDCVQQAKRKILQIFDVEGENPHDARNVAFADHGRGGSLDDQLARPPVSTYQQRSGFGMDLYYPPTTNIQQQSMAQRNFQQPFPETNFQQPPLARTHFQQPPLEQTNFQQQSMAQTNFQQQSMAWTNFQQQSMARTNFQQQSMAPNYPQQQSLAPTLPSVFAPSHARVPHQGGFQGPIDGSGFGAAPHTCGAQPPDPALYHGAVLSQPQFQQHPIGGLSHGAATPQAQPTIKVTDPLTIMIPPSSNVNPPMRDETCTMSVLLPGSESPFLVPMLEKDAPGARLHVPSEDQKSEDPFYADRLLSVAPEFDAQVRFRSF